MLGFGLPATPFLSLKIAPITDTFQGAVSGHSRAGESDALTWINPVSHTQSSRGCHGAFGQNSPGLVVPRLLFTGESWLALPGARGPYTHTPVRPYMQDTHQDHHNCSPFRTYLETNTAVCVCEGGGGWLAAELNNNKKSQFSSSREAQMWDHWSNAAASIWVSLSNACPRWPVRKAPGTTQRLND